MATIALFDSGVGGLSVLSAIKQRLPSSDIIYLADHQASPYGDKDTVWLNNRIVDLVSTLNEHHSLDAIIIACNTASTLSLEMLRNAISTPIIGVVPAVKTAATLTKNHSIGILATPTTIKSRYLTELIHQFASECHITSVGNIELVKMAEEKLAGQPIDLIKLEQIIGTFKHNHCDHVILGCTHFPLLKDELSSLAPSITWVDSAQAIANRCESILTANNIVFTTNNSQANHLFYSTKVIPQGLYHTLSSIGFNQIEFFPFKQEMPYTE